jgi:hypothetical protein
MEEPSDVIQLHAAGWGGGKHLTGIGDAYAKRRDEHCKRVKERAAAPCKRFRSLCELEVDFMLSQRELED